MTMVVPSDALGEASAVRGRTAIKAATVYSLAAAAFAMPLTIILPPQEEALLPVDVEF